MVAGRPIAFVGRNRFAWASALLVVVSALGCGDDAKPGPTPSGGAVASAALPDALALAAEPAGAQPIGAIVASLNGSATVVASGRVGVEGKDAAYFSLVDPSQKACTDMGDECKTPWDYCCTPPDVMSKQSATVEFRVGGQLVGTSVLGFHGLDHLKDVVVTGTAKKDSTGNVTIEASGIWVKSP